MSEVICVVPVAPLRAEGSHRAEMVSQILFGETGVIISETKDFYQIHLLHQTLLKLVTGHLQIQLVAADSLPDVN